MAVIKKRRKCVTGKNCGGSCINRMRTCRIELRLSYQEALKKYVGAVQGRKTITIPETLPDGKEELYALHQKVAKAYMLERDESKAKILADKIYEIDGKYLKIKDKPKSKSKSTSEFPEGREEIIALRREKLSQFLQHVRGQKNDPVAKKKLGEEIDALDAKYQKFKDADLKLKDGLKIKDSLPSDKMLPSAKMALLKERAPILAQYRQAKNPSEKKKYKDKLDEISQKFQTFKNQDARVVDAKFDENLATKKIKKIGDAIDFEQSKVKGSKVLGAGSYGQVVKSATGNQAHKRGDIGKEEVKALEIAAAAGLGPKFYGAELDGAGKEKGTKLGRLAMEALDATPLGEREPNSKINGRNAADIYWETRAGVHRLGIQHGDMHHQNVLVDKNGKGKIIDMGIAKVNPRAALSEALGVFGMGGDWQAKRWNSTGGTLLKDVEGRKVSIADFAYKAPLLKKVYDNNMTVYKAMMEAGLSLADIKNIQTTKIRSPDKDYATGSFAKIDDQQAMKFINMLYDGV